MVAVHPTDTYLNSDQKREGGGGRGGGGEREI